MADLTQTAANVSLTDNATFTIEVVKYGEAVTQGMPVYLNSTDGKYYKASPAAVATSVCKGVALTPGADTEKGIIVTSGYIDVGATLTVGESYYISAGGAIKPVADVASSEFPCFLGIAETAGKLIVDIRAAGVAKA